MTSTRTFTVRILRTFLMILATVTLLAPLATTAFAQNPVPFIDQPLVPDAAAPGGAGFTLTVNGAGFVAGSTVNWNGSPRATTFVTSSKLTVKILASDIATASTAAVTVVNPSPGGGVSNTQFFSIALPEASVSFLPVVTYPSGAGGGYLVAVADVNGDGKLDLMVANGNGGGGGSVAVLLGNGDGTFQPAITYDAGGTQTDFVAVADVNGDGKPDLVVANSISLTIGVLLGNGDGTFQPAVTYNSGGSPWSVAVADVNGDGKADIIVGDASSCYGCSGRGLVGVLLGNGDGTFQPVVTYDSGGYSYGTSPTALVLADLDGDGKLDIVMTNYCSNACTYPTAEGNVSVLLGNGDGTFHPAVSYGSGGYGLSIGALAVADVNGDGKPDLMVVNGNCVYGGGCGEGTVAVLLGNGNGTFQPAVLYGSGVDNSASVAVGDVNGNGKPDLMVTNFCAPGGCTDPGTGSVGVLLGNGDGTFQTPATYNSGGAWGAFSAVVADVNRDGQPDLLMVNFEGSSVGVLLNSRTSPPCIGKCATSTVLASSLNPSIQGQSITFTATVTSPGGPPPSGEFVAFYNGSVFLGSAALSGGKASFKTSSLQGGISTITASYVGDANFAASTSPGLQQVVNTTTRFATATALVSGLNPSIYGQKVTWTATVTTTGKTIPTGKVKVTWGIYLVAEATLNASGVATLTRPALNADTYPLTAVYGGDANNLASTSAVLNQVVTETTSSAALTSSPNPSTPGQPVTFTATIKSPTVAATGPVTFTAGKTVLGTAQLADGKATFTISTLALGTTKVTANYYGDSNIASSAASVKQTVSSAPSLIEDDGELPVRSKTARPASGCESRTTLTSTGSPSLIGNQVVFSASVYALAFCNNLPQGDCYEQITFYDGNTVIGSAPLNNSCIATLTDNSLTARTHKIKARFPGTGEGDTPSYSNAVTQVVTGYPTTTTLSSSLTPSAYGQSVTWTATVTSPSGYVTSPTGKVDFTWGGVYTIGSAPLNASGVATLTKSNLNADSYPLTAAYVGDPNNAGSFSAILSQVVTQTTSAASLTSSPNPSVEGQAVTFLADITSPTITATGPVTFSIGNTVLGTAELAGGKARFTTSTLPVGANPVTVTYSGDSNISGSTASVTEAVQP